MRIFYVPFPVVFFLLLICALCDRHSALADCRSFAGLVRNGGYAVADRDATIVTSCNENVSFIPASVIKIPLALAAFDILGPDFRFRTEFYLDSSDNLYIKGYGDPFLISEEVALIAGELTARGVRAVNSILIDDSAADTTGQPPGRGGSDNPYDAPVSPSAVNFNTVNIRVDSKGRVESAEEQTPTLPLMRELGKNLKPGGYRLNVCQDDCDPVLQSARYAAELFRALLAEKGILVNGSFGLEDVPPGLKPVYVHANTRTLENLVASILKHSNNFIANQVFLRCGAERFGLPSDWQKGGRAVAEALARLLGSESGRIVMEEGSGLSRNNTVTATAMLKALEIFRPHAELLPEKGTVRIKSGTLDGVYNYAGYLADGKAFVILLNQKENNRDKVLARLAGSKR